MSADVTSELPEPQPLPGPVKPADFQEACPFLGLERDPATRARQPTSAHRCYRDYRTPRAISEGHQLGYCLTSTFAECPAYPNGWGTRARRTREGTFSAPFLVSSAAVALALVAIAIWLLLR